MLGRLSPTRIALAAVAALVAAGIAATTIQRVPKGYVTLDGTNPVARRLILHAPFVTRRTILAQGKANVSGVEIKTREGSTLGFGLEVDYSLSRSLAPQLAGDLRQLGLEAALRGMAQRVLDDAARRSDTETLVASPALVEAPLKSALEAGGIEVARLSFRCQLGDEVVRRNRSEQARSLSRRLPTRVLVIGWDGADWDIAAPLIAAGRMPNLARIVRQGAWTELRSFDPMFSPLLWTTVATGKSPTEHGIADFLVRDGSTGERRPITSNFRRVKAIWNVLTDFEIRSAWIGWWATYPAESTLGLLVTDYLGAAIGTKPVAEAAALPGIMHPPGALTNPNSLLVSPASISRDDVRQIIPVSDEDYKAALGAISNASSHARQDRARPENAVGFVMCVMAVARSYHNIAIDELKSGMPVVGIYYEGIDMVGHGFQHYLPPKMSFVSDANFERYKEAIPHYYEFQDRLLGELMDAAGPDTVTVLLSDHGFRTGERRPNFPPSTKGQPEEWHRDWGILAIHGSGIRAGKIPPASIFDIAPTLLYLCGLPIADDMPGRLVAAAFEPDVLRRTAPAHLRSYELVGSRLEHTSNAQADPAATREMMANLRALGYIGGGDDEAKAPTDESTSTEGPSETQYFYHRNLAVLYIRQGRFKDAESELLLANERKPQGKTYEMLSQTRANQGRYREAVAALDEGWTRAPETMDPSTLLWIVELELLAGDVGGARGAAAKWDARATPAVRLAIEGRLRDAGGDPAGAADAYRRALAEDPLMVRTAQRLHELDIARGQPFAIEPFLISTLNAHPQVDAYWDMAGQLALARGEFATAVERFEKATSLQPDDGLYLGHLASAQAAAGRDGDARASLAWAERFPPSDAEGWMAIGGAWDRLADADRAVAAFGAARTAGMKGPGADVGAAVALARAGRTSEALKVLDDAERRFPGNPVLSQVRQRIAR